MWLELSEVLFSSIIYLSIHEFKRTLDLIIGVNLVMQCPLNVDDHYFILIKIPETSILVTSVDHF